MNLTLINEIWKLLKPDIEVGDVNAAAETLINYLVEEDFSPTELQQIFRNDRPIKEALSFYLEKPEDGLVHEYEDDLDEDLDFNDYGYEYEYDEY